MLDDELVKAELARHICLEHNFAAVFWRESGQSGLLACLIDNPSHAAFGRRHLSDQGRVDRFVRNAKCYGLTAS